MKSSLERERELSYKLLSAARAKRAGYDSQATRRILSDSVTNSCPTITPYDWQLDLAEALILGLDATVVRIDLEGTQGRPRYPRWWS